MNNILIIIPTYNESDNISIIINKILTINPDYKILVVDGKSTDNTSTIVNDLKKNNPNIYLISQVIRNGIGGAYCEGFLYAIRNNFKKVIQIDSDLSHDPKDIPRLIEKSDEYDLVIGSRYVNGISIVNWPISRLFLSYFANVYAKLFTGMNIQDCTGGFKCINVDILKNINLDKINSHGYSFQIEMNYLTYIKKYKIIEIPIIFKDRLYGKSKMSKKIIVEAIFIVPFLRLKSLLSKCYQ